MLSSNVRYFYSRSRSLVVYTTIHQVPLLVARGLWKSWQGWPWLGGPTNSSRAYGISEICELFDDILHCPYLAPLFLRNGGSVNVVIIADQQRHPVTARCRARIRWLSSLSHTSLGSLDSHQPRSLRAGQLLKAGQNPNASCLVTRKPDLHEATRRSRMVFVDAEELGELAVIVELL